MELLQRSHGLFQALLWHLLELQRAPELNEDAVLELLGVQPRKFVFVFVFFVFVFVVCSHDIMQAA